MYLPAVPQCTFGDFLTSLRIASLGSGLEMPLCLPLSPTSVPALLILFPPCLRILSPRCSLPLLPLFDCCSPWFVKLLTSLCVPMEQHGAKPPTLLVGMLMAVFLTTENVVAVGSALSRTAVMSFCKASFAPGLPSIHVVSPVPQPWRSQTLLCSCGQNLEPALPY